MPVDAVQSISAAQTRPTRPTSRTGDFGNVLTQVLKSGPKLSGQEADPFKATTKPQRFMSLNRDLYNGEVSLSGKTLAALGAATKFPAGTRARGAR